MTRRAFRSGENQYLINGRKVRLKDVAHLTAGLGQSHVVVGQGLVDAALSLRAEERRGLFEHAADLTGLRLKVAEAERNLAETEANTDRLRDLLTELEPRLSSSRAGRAAGPGMAGSSRSLARSAGRSLPRLLGLSPPPPRRRPGAAEESAAAADATRAR